MSAGHPALSKVAPRVAPDATPAATGAVPKTTDGPGGETLDDHHYQLWADWLERQTGVHIHDHREPFVRRALARRLAELNLGGEDYCAGLLHAGANSTESQHLVDWLLIKETTFFRHRESHEFVRQVVHRHARESAAGLNFWSVGCATGEEAYSLALDARAGFEAAGQSANFAVIGTDISRKAVDLARRGQYPIQVLRADDRQRLAAVLEPVGSGQFRFAAAIRDRLAFFTDNLVAQRSGFFPEGVDIIFCQNLLIYFRRWRRHETLNFLARRLKPGGYLIVGPGECTDWQPAGLEKVRWPSVAAYRRPLDSEVSAGD